VLLLPSEFTLTFSYRFLSFLSLQDAGGFSPPRRGKNNDQAHPPIHPTAHAGNLAGDEKRIYEFITRRFLACCSKDALGFETIVGIVYGGEDFHAKGMWQVDLFYHTLA
jgi:DNA topoisomerase III